MKEFYITDKAGSCIQDIDEAINNSLEEIKNCYQFRKVKSFTYKITSECEFKNQTKEEVKTTKIFFNTDYILKIHYMNMVTSNNGYILKKIYMRVMAMILSFLDIDKY